MVRELWSATAGSRNQLAIGRREGVTFPDFLEPIEELKLFYPSANHSRDSTSGFFICLGHQRSHPFPAVSIALDEMTDVIVLHRLQGIVNNLLLLVQ